MLPTDNRRKRSWRILIRRPLKWIYNNPKVLALIAVGAVFIGVLLMIFKRPMEVVSPSLWENGQRYMRDLPLPFAKSSERAIEQMIDPFWQQSFSTEEQGLRVPRNRMESSTILMGFQSDMPLILWDQSAVPRTNVATFNETIQSQIQYVEISDDKRLPYGTNTRLFDKYDIGTRQWLNTFSTFPGVTSERLHGQLGVTADGLPVYTPKPMPAEIHKVGNRIRFFSIFIQFPGGYEAALKHGGFYHNLSEALPLDRLVPDHRENICRNQKFDVAGLPDASIVITYFNEPFSTLMRTVHSVLNQTPPELIREIILVDDHSDYLWAGTGSVNDPLNRKKDVTIDTTTSAVYTSIIEEYIRYLPKVKLLRLPERRGLVHARLAGARAAGGKVLVVLDSHVEVNKGWLEPQLARIKEQPNAIVFPQILSINPETFQYDKDSGIGCKLGFKWSMVEQSTMSKQVTDVSPIPSGSMAGGLFAVKLDYFWHIGGYDEAFRMWGSENVEMGFRTWLCGGRLECMPCSKTFHIYRKKGGGYASPAEDIVRNKLRTARLWTDEYYTLARTFIAPKDGVEPGNLDKMIELKERLQCKPFQWYLDNIPFSSNNKFVTLKPDDVRRLGEVKTTGARQWCLDTMQRVEADQAAGVFPCHGDGGTQAWLYVESKEWSHIVPTGNERFCLSYDGKYRTCEEDDRHQQWELLAEPAGVEVRIKSKVDGKCLGVAQSKLAMLKCEDVLASWTWPVHQNPTFEPLRYSPEHSEKLIAFGHGHLI